MKLLHLDSSVLGDVSASRALSREVVEAWRAREPSLEVVYRDLDREPLEHVSTEGLAALSLPADLRNERQRQIVARNEAVLDEFLAADALVIAAPMYNFSVPSQLKAWIDRICVAGRTFRYTENGPQGLAGGKKVVIVSTAGGLHAGQPSGQAHEEFLLRIMDFVGITDVEIVRAQGLAYGEAPRNAALDDARRAIGGLFATA